MPALTPQALARRIQAAQGRIDCDLILRDATYLDVFACEWRKGSLAVIDGVIVGVDPGLRSKRTIDLRGRKVVPGFIDAHLHVESSMMVPANFERAALPRGTTTAVCDPHELANVQGVPGIRYFLDSASELALDLWVMLSSCVPATHLETNGGGTIDAALLAPLRSHPRALGLAEMMNMPGVLNADPAVLDKLSAFAGHRIDGHAPLLRGLELSAYAACGISSCHESSELEEAREKLAKGIAVWIREGSVAKDLEALIPLLTVATSASLGFCTDDRNPLDILTEGHLDHLVRQAIRHGQAPIEAVYRAASWSVARHYGLDRGPRRVGAVAPGYLADLVILEDAETVAVDRVLKAGRFSDEIETVSGIRQDLGNSVRAQAPELADLAAPQGPVHVIQVMPGKILTGHEVLPHDHSGVKRLTVLERYGRGSKPANGYVAGFGESLRGAIGSSVGHDSHNLIAVGDRPEEIRAALGALIRMGGGFCVVRDGQVLAELPLPFGGLMTAAEPAELKRSLEALKAASQAIGCVLPEPFLQLAFLSLPVIPSLKLTDQGLVDVDRFALIPVSAA